jgi:hypothetical protein
MKLKKKKIQSEDLLSVMKKYQTDKDIYVHTFSVEKATENKKCK